MSYLLAAAAAVGHCLRRQYECTVYCAAPSRTRSAGNSSYEKRRGSSEAATGPGIDRDRMGRRRRRRIPRRRPQTTGSPHCGRCSPRQGCVAGKHSRLRWSDVDLTAGRATVVRTASYVGKEVTFTDPKTRAGRRLVPLPAGTVTALRENRKTQAAEQLAAGELYQPGSLVFADELGRPHKPGNVTRAFAARAVKAAGLPTITLHGLRHTFATIAAGARVPVKVVSELIGHSSTAITQDLYVTSHRAWPKTP